MSDQTVLSAMSVLPFADEELYAAAYRLASPVRRQKTDRLRMDKDRHLSLGADVLLRHILQSFDIRSYVLDYTAFGKPVLQGSDICVSISHSGSYVLCAASDHAVGCDIEKIEPVDIKIAKRFFCPEEYADIAAEPTAQAQYAMFYRYWTLKESFMKITGLGMKLPLNAFQIVPQPRLTVRQHVNENAYGFAEYGNIPGYACALCTVGTCCDVPLQTAELTKLLTK